MSLFIPRRYRRSRTCLPMLAAIAEAVEALEPPEDIEDVVSWRLQANVRFQSDIRAKKRDCPNTGCQFWEKCTHRTVQLSFFG